MVRVAGLVERDGGRVGPIEPSAFLARLQVLGFRKITLIVDYGLMFIAHKPAPAA